MEKQNSEPNQNPNPNNSLVLMSQYNTQRGMEKIEDTFADLGSVIGACQFLLSMTPDLTNLPKASETWGKIRSGVLVIMENSQIRAKQMFDASMKVKVVDSSVSRM